MAISFKGAHFPKEVILMGVRWYVAYPLSTRHVEELMEERGVELDHATINRWVIKYSPQIEEAFHRRKRPVWVSWRLDETYIKVKGEWHYLYRAVDKYGKTIDFLLTEQRDGLCRKFQFWGLNPKTRHRQFNDLQTIKLSKKQICDRAHLKTCRFWRETISHRQGRAGYSGIGDNCEGL